MELDPPGATTTIDHTDRSSPGAATAQQGARLSVARTAGLGLVGTAAILVGSVMGGQSFETHLAGAWFFGMPGGLFGSYGTNDSLPTIVSLALVFGGLILLTRVWLGFLRYLKDNPGFPVKRVVFVALVWAVPLLLAPPLFSRDVYTYAAQGEMVSHHINPYSYGPNVLGATPFNEMADVGVVGLRVAVRANLPDRRRRARPGLGPFDPARPGAAAALGGGGHRIDGGSDAHLGPIAET